jgi:NAD(P)-dependent dehydrogenase (short-subunit alcohol dehydrogenase family)
MSSINWSNEAIDLAEARSRTFGIERFDLTGRTALVTGSSRGLGYTKFLVENWVRVGGTNLTSAFLTGQRHRPRLFRDAAHSGFGGDEELSAWVRTRTPAGRWGQDEDLAGALLYLASDASTFVNGQTLYVDGCLTAVI